MGLNNGIIVFVHDIDDPVACKRFYIMWNDDYYIDEFYMGIYCPHENIAYVGLHMVHDGRCHRVRGENAYHYVVYAVRSLYGREPVVRNTGEKLFKHGEFVVLGDDEFYGDVIDSVVYASKEAVLRRLREHAVEVRVAGVEAEAIPFNELARMLHEDLAFRDNVMMLYYLMERTPSPLGLYMVNIYETHGGEFVKAETTLRFSYKYREPPVYHAVIDPGHETCSIEDGRVFCTDGYTGVEVPLRLIGGCEKEWPPGRINFKVTRFIGDSPFKGYVREIKSYGGISRLLYHITYGYIW